MSLEDKQKWTHDLENSTQKCPQCGSGKITRYLMGRLDMRYVDWANEESRKRGYEILVLGGCTTPGMDTCSQCGADVPR